MLYKGGDRNFSVLNLVSLCLSIYALGLAIGSIASDNWVDNSTTAPDAFFRKNVNASTTFVRMGLWEGTLYLTGSQPTNTMGFKITDCSVVVNVAGVSYNDGERIFSGQRCSKLFVTKIFCLFSAVSIFLCAIFCSISLCMKTRWPTIVGAGWALFAGISGVIATSVHASMLDDFTSTYDQWEMRRAAYIFLGSWAIELCVFPLLVIAAIMWHYSTLEILDKPVLITAGDNLHASTDVAILSSKAMSPTSKNGYLEVRDPPQKKRSTWSERLFS